MIAKKSKSADLERKRFAFFQIGMIIAGATTLVAFEYSTANAEDKKTAVMDEPIGLTIFTPDNVYEEQERPTESNNTESQVIMQPVDEIRIVTNPINPNLIYSDQIVVTEPCLDCIEIGDLVDPGDPILPISEVDPQFPGGELELIKFIVDNVNYPEMEREMGAEELIYVHFVVNKDGSITDIRTENGVYENLAKEARRVIAIMPNWTPGEQAGKPVRVRYTVPINFQVRNN